MNESNNSKRLNYVNEASAQSLGHPLSIRLRKVCTAPSSVDITMTSILFCEKTSLSVKRRMIEVKLLLNTNKESGLPILNPSLVTVYSAPWRRYNDDITSG